MCPNSHTLQVTAAHFCQEMFALCFRPFPSVQLFTDRGNQFQGRQWYSTECIFAFPVWFFPLCLPQIMYLFSSDPKGERGQGLFLSIFLLITLQGYFNKEILLWFYHWQNSSQNKKINNKIQAHNPSEQCFLPTKWTKFTSYQQTLNQIFLQAEYFSCSFLALSLGKLLVFFF